MRTTLIVFLIVLVSCSASAEVTQSDTHGFIIEHSFTITKPPAAVFGVMTGQIDQWWNAEHSYSGQGENMSLDKNCFCERWDNNLVHHLDTAIWLENSRVVLTGGLGPLKDLGLDGTMLWSLAPSENNDTTVSWKYYVYGYSDTDVVAFAPVVDGVLAEQIKRLEAHLGK